MSNPSLAARALLAMACPLAYAYVAKSATPVAPLPPSQAKSNPAGEQT